MVLEEVHNEHKFYLFIEDGIVYIMSSPEIDGAKIEFKHVDGSQSSVYFVDLKSNCLCWFKKDYIDNIIILNISKDDKSLFNKIIIRNLELSLIKKDDISIVIDNSLNLELCKDIYSKYGNVTLENNNETKYVIYLKNYLINFTYLVNKLFFNQGKILHDDNKNIIAFERNQNNMDFLEIDNLKIKNLSIWY